MILITGATGFLGRNLLKNLPSETRIKCLVRKIPSIEKGNLEFIKGDMSDKASLIEATKNVETVIHMAAIIKSKNKKDFQKINVDGTDNLLKACKQNGVKNIIHISSYDVVLKKKNYYAISKLKSENLVRSSELDYTILRPTVIYGEGELNNLGKLFQIIKKFPLVPVIGNGKYLLQPVYVQDLVKIIIKSVENPKTNKTFFVAGPRPITFNAIINKASKQFSKNLIKIYIPLFFIKLILSLLPSEYSNILSIVENKTCNISETINHFNLKPLSFEEGLEKTIKSYS